MELADKMSFPSMAVTVDVNVVLVQLRYKKKKVCQMHVRFVFVFLNIISLSEVSKICMKGNIWKEILMWKCKARP